MGGTWLTFRTFFVAVFLFFLIFLSGFYAWARALEIIRWTDWRINNGKPLIFSGYVDGIFEYRGRRSGTQRLRLVDVNGEIVFVRSVLDKELLRNLVGKKHILFFKYYPVPTGLGYVFDIRLYNEVLYQADFVDSTYIAFGIFLFYVLFLIFLFFLIFIFIRIFRGISYASD